MLVIVICWETVELVEFVPLV